MSKDIPSWQRTEPMSIDEARRRTRNWLRNSTRCCYQGEGERTIGGPCEHTAEWIEAEAAQRMEAANEWMGWSNRLGDLLPNTSAVKTGRILADAGLRNEKGHPSETALAGDEPMAAWVEHHGYPVAIWCVERVREAVASLAVAA
jgi:hypothetical protein